MDWFKRNWKKLAAVGCGVASVVVAPINPLAAVGVAYVCGALGVTATQEYLAAKQVTEIAKQLIKK